MLGRLDAMFQNWLSGPRPRHGRPEAALFVHDPAAQRPHDLDDPFFDAKVQERVGRVIADAMERRRAA